MRSLLLVSVLMLFCVSFAAEKDGPCLNRSVSVDLEKGHVVELDGLFSAQSNLPYTFTVKNKNKSLSTLVISYRRKGPKDDYQEPVNPSFYKDVADKLSDRYESLGIKKLSAQIIPGACP